MQFTLSRETLLKPLQMVSGIVERRQAMPILSNVLVVAQEGQLFLTGTDTEIELLAKIPLLDGKVVPGQITVPGKKFIDLCKALPEGAKVRFSLQKEKVLLQSGISRFVLSCLPAKDYPSFEPTEGEIAFSLKQAQLKYLLENTSFALAQQDVRQYLHGLLLELTPQQIKAVATDGHRLAICTLPCDLALTETQSVIVPRKAVLELNRIFAESGEVQLTIGEGRLSAVTPEYQFTTSLVDSKYPNYKTHMVRQAGHEMIADKSVLRQTLARASVLLSERHQGVSLLFSEGKIRVLGRNTEHDEIDDFVDVQYEGPEYDISFNVHYLMEYLGIIRTPKVKMTLIGPRERILLEPFGGEDDENKEGESLYILMPMKI